MTSKSQIVLYKKVVSVIIPTYNRSQLLREAMESVIAQTYRPIECIVVDDGSTDDTREVVSKIEKTEISSFTVKYIYQQNAGAQVARNTGTAASTGEFIQYLDSDDLLYSEKIEKQVIFFNGHSDCDGVWGGWAKGTSAKNEIIKSLAREDLLTQFLTEHCIVNFSFLFRRTIVEKIGQWDEKIKRNQEIDFQVRGLLAGANYLYQPQICGLWRVHEGERIANTTGGKEFLKFYQKWEKILTEKGLFNEQMKKNISNTYLWQANINRRNKPLCLELLNESVRLNPEVHFVRTRKMQILKKFFGLKYSLRFWRWRSLIDGANDRRGRLKDGDKHLFEKKFVKR